MANKINDPFKAPSIVDPFKAPPAAPSADSGSAIGDIGRSLLGGGIQAAAGMVRSGSEALRSISPSLPAADLIRGGSEAINRAGESVGTVSAAGQEAVRQSQITGSIADPTTWGFGEDPSARGYGIQLAQGLGSSIPTIATGALTRGNIGASAAVAASAGGGFAAQDEAQRIRDMPIADLQKLPGYQERVRSMTPEQARENLALDTGNAAFRYTAPVSSIDAAFEVLPFTGAAQRALGRAVGTSRVARAAAGAGTGAVGEGLQEVAEQAAQTYGGDTVTGENRDVLADSLGNFVLGAAAGGTIGGVAGAIQGVDGQRVVGASDDANTVVTENRNPQPKSGDTQPETAETQTETTIVQPGDGPMSKAVAIDAAESSGTPLGPVVVTTTLANEQDLRAQGERQGADETAAEAESKVAAGEKPNGPGPEAVTVTPVDAGIPTSKTMRMRATLRERGWGTDQIEAMTPQQAWSAIQNGEAPAPAPAQVAAPAAAAPQAQPATDTPSVSRDQIEQVIQTRLDSSPGPIDVNMVARALGVTPREVAAVRRDMRKRAAAQPAAEAATTENRPNGRNETDTGTVRSSPQSALFPGTGPDGTRTGEVPAGRAGKEGGQEGRKEGTPRARAGKEGRAEEGRKEALTYNESREPLDGDTLTSSGTPFTIRAAAELAARRTPDGRVFEVDDGGFVVRTPTESTDAQGTQSAATSAADPGRADSSATAATQQVPAATAAPVAGAANADGAPATAGRRRRAGAAKPEAVAVSAEARPDIDAAIPADLRARRDRAAERSRVAGAALDAFPKGPMNLTTDEAKASPEWKAAKKEADAAAVAEQKINAQVAKARKAAKKAAGPALRGRDPDSAEAAPAAAAEKVAPGAPAQEQAQAVPAAAAADGRSRAGSSAKTREKSAKNKATGESVPPTAGNEGLSAQPTKKKAKKSTIAQMIAEASEEPARKDWPAVARDLPVREDQTVANLSAPGRRITQALDRAHGPGTFALSTVTAKYKDGKFTTVEEGRGAKSWTLVHMTDVPQGVGGTKKTKAMNENTVIAIPIDVDPTTPEFQAVIEKAAADYVRDNKIDTSRPSNWGSNFPVPKGLEPLIEGMAPYGYSLNGTEIRRPDGRNTGTVVGLVGRRAQVRAGDTNQLLWSGEPTKVGDFLTTYWFAKKKTEGGDRQVGDIAFSRPEDQTKNSAFKKWFGSSKVVDSKGNPLVVYHGTDADIRAFDTRMIGNNFGADDRGFFFTSSPVEASRYAENDTIGINKREGANVIPAYISIKKPLIIDPDFLAKEGMGGLLGKDGSEDTISFWDNYQSVIHEWADERRADGVIVVDPAFTEANGEPRRMVVAFKPEQIKSAFGNSGSFDPRNADITLSRPLPSRSRDPRSHIVGVNDLRQMADRVVGKWKGDIPTVRVIESARELPAVARRATGWETAEGYYDGRSTVYLIANNLPNMTRAEQVLAHEAIGHYGVEGVLGRDQWSAITSTVARMRRNPGSLDAEVRGALDSVESRYPDADAVTFAREMLAVMAERGVSTPLMSRILGTLRRFLRSIGINVSRWGDSELRDVLARGMHQVQDRARARADGARSQALAAAYHGTPTRGIEQFDLQKIGTGEGNQSFGWGMYFASRREVADWYRRKLTGITRDPGSDAADRAMQAAGNDRARAIQMLTRAGDTAALEALRRDPNRGQLYEVSVPEADVLLDWDAAIDEQPSHVQKALEALPWYENSLDQMEDSLYGSSPTGRDLYRWLTQDYTPQEASEILSEAGIPGLRFLDGASRSRDSGSHNYVIWQQDQIGQPVGLMSRPDRGAAAEPFRGMTREQFLGSPKITRAANAADLVPRARRNLDSVEAVPFDAGFGMTAKYSPEGAVVLQGDKPVASYYNGDTLVVDKKYRRQGIGAELVYQWRLRNPGAKPAAERTKASQALQESVWDRIQGDLSGRGYFSQKDPAEVMNSLGTALRSSDSLASRLKDKLEDARPAMLGALTIRQLGEISESYLPAVGQYVDTMTEMASRRGILQEQVGDMAQRWQAMQSADRRAATAEQKRNRDTDSDRTVDLMHDATVAGTDPAEAFRPSTLRLTSNGDEVVLTKDGAQPQLDRINSALEALKNEPKTDAAEARRRTLLSDRARITAGIERNAERQRAYGPLVRQFNALPEQWQQLYRDVRDSYVKRSEETLDALMAKIEALETAKPDVKAALRDRLRAEFESARVEAPYFPLARFGEYWASVEKTASDGTVDKQFVMAETKRERDKAITAAERDGYTLKGMGRKLDTTKAEDGASGTFVATVNDILTDAGVDDKVRDDIYQLYLRTMPDLSTRKNFIHRKKVAGYDQDALRAFASNMFHSSHQLAKLEFGPKLERALKATDEQTKAAQNSVSPDADRASAARNELRRRHEWVMNPTNANWVQNLSGLNFVYYLGLSPAAALVNLSQTAITTFPALASRYGTMKALNTLLQTTRDAIKNIRFNDNTGIKRSLTNADEVRAYDDLRRMGAIDVTQAHDLAGLSEASTTGYNATQHKVMNLVSFMFHKAEVINREASGIAAYRLAREAGESHDQALKTASDTIWETHFDYSSANRARFMQGDAAKILFAFKQYSQSMTYFLWRSMYQATKGETPEVRRQARNRLMGAIGMTGVFSGLMGMPLLSVMFGIANAANAAFGDDDEPWDAETEFKNFLADMLGPTFGRIAREGLVEGGLGALGLSAPEIGSRVSLNELWFRSPDADAEGRDLYTHLLEQVAGPIAGIFGGGLTGASLISEGLDTGNSAAIWRGVEKMLPKTVRDSMKALRYETQGVNTLRGDPLIADTDVLQGIYQGMGFSPSEVIDQYAVNASRKSYEKEIKDRRSTLLNAYALALKHDDREAAATVLRKIQGFNKANPEVGITPSTMRATIKARAKYSERAVNGVALDRRTAGKVQDAIRFGAGGSESPDEE